MTPAVIAVAGGVGLVFVAWRVHVRNRRLRVAHARLAAMHGRRDERAARAATAPRTGNVAVSPIHPPTNGRP
jgi:hypothetical protein